jgi:hypothetical protein
MKTRGVIATAALLLYFCIAAAVGWAGYELKQAFSPNTHKTEIAKADADAAALAKQAEDTQAKLQADIAANKSAIAASEASLASQLTIEQDAAGFLSGVLVAIPGDDTATMDEKIAAILAKDAAGTLPPATGKQVQEFTSIVAQMRADNARLSAALIAKEQEAAQDKAAAAVSAQAAATAKAQAIVSDTAAKVSADQTQAASAALAVNAAKLDGKTAENITFLKRLKALGIGSGILVVIAIGLSVWLFGAKKTLTDSVALLEYVKGEAVKAGHDAVSLEQKIVSWWGGAKGEKVVANIKDKVLRL